MIGGLRHQIDLLAQVRTLDGGGGASIIYAPSTRLWAGVTQLSSIVAQRGDGPYRAQRIEARIRRRHTVAIGDRVRWKGSVYEIVSIEDDDTERRFVVLIGEEALL